MLSALAIFEKNLVDVRLISSLHDYLSSSIKAPISFDDLLRSQMVYSVSAFDKLIHDIIRIGMVDIFLGRRPATDKYLSESISLAAYNSVSNATVPPKEYYFEREIATKLKSVAYQDPDKVAGGLAYIWDEKFKWQKIAAQINLNENGARTQLRLIVDRRNSIVHEADIDVVTGDKRPISKSDSEMTVDFIQKCGAEIVGLVR